MNDMTMQSTTRVAAPAAPIYMDYAATTPVDPEVIDAMTRCLSADGNFGNPASRSHVFGWKAEEAVEQARAQVAALINADPREIVWTLWRHRIRSTWPSRASRTSTQSNAASTSSPSRRSNTRAVLDTCRELERQRLRRLRI